MKTNFREINTRLLAEACNKTFQKDSFFIFQKLKFVWDSNQKSAEVNSKPFKDRRSDPFCLMTQIPRKAGKTALLARDDTKEKRSPGYKGVL